MGLEAGHYLRHGPRRMGLPDAQHEGPPAGEDDHLLARNLRDRRLQGRPLGRDHGHDRRIPRERHGQVPRHRTERRPQPRDDLLARQQRKPQRTHQRELGPRAARALHDGSHELYRGRCLRVFPRLHGMDDGPEAAPVPHGAFRLGVRLPRRDSRPHRQELSGSRR